MSTALELHTELNDQLAGVVASLAKARARRPGRSLAKARRAPVTDAEIREAVDLATAPLRKELTQLRGLLPVVFAEAHRRRRDAARATLAKAAAQHVLSRPADTESAVRSTQADLIGRQLAKDTLRAMFQDESLAERAARIQAEQIAAHLAQEPASAIPPWPSGAKWTPLDPLLGPDAPQGPQPQQRPERRS